MLATLASVASVATGVDLNAILESLGPFAAAGAIGYLAWKRESKRADAANTRADALVDRVLDQAIPAIERQTAAQREFIDAARELRWAAQHGGDQAPPGHRGG